MNTIQITTKKNNENELEKIELTLSKEIENIIMDAIHLLAVVQGERKEVEQGMIYYCFYLSTNDAEELKEAFLQAYTKVSGYNTEN